MPEPAIVLDWTEKHRPRSLAELVGNSKAIEEMNAWAHEWKTGMPKERALVLAGDPGIGKTSAAYALARDHGWGVIELNASDQRNEEVIRRIAGSGATHRAFGDDGSFQTAGRQLVILDEADNLFGKEDRGGMKAILDTIRDARQPIVLIANDLYELQRRGSSLKTLARTIKFTKVHTNSIPPALRRIAQREGLQLEIGVDKAIAERAGGDMRSAVNDLQALATGRTLVALTDVEALGRRDTTGDVWELLGKVFYGTDANAARKAAWDLDETPEDLALWIDENLPLLYADRADLVEGYAALSKASLMIGRVTRRQQYGLWAYATELMTAGVAAAKSTRPSGARFSFPSWLRRQATSKAVRDVRDRTAAKVGNVLHTSKMRARNDIFPFLRQLLAADERLAAWSAWRFEFEADELAFVLDEKAASVRIKSILEHAKEFEVLVTRPDGSPFGRYAEASEEEDAAEPVRSSKGKVIASGKATTVTAGEKLANAKAATPEAGARLEGSKQLPATTGDEPSSDQKKRQRSLSDF